MKVLLLTIVFAFVFWNCSAVDDYGTGPTKTDTVYVTPPDTFKASTILNGKTTTWIEVEYELPQDTTWWTLCADGTMYAAWKRKIVNYNGWLPIQYEKGGWGVNSKNLMTLTPRTVLPANGNDLVRATWVQTQLFFCYITWTSGTDSTLVGYQAYEDGKVMNVKDDNPDVVFRKWNGKHLNDINNPIFLQ